MAIDTAAKRRNANRMMRVSCLMGLAPSSGLDTADRINVGRAYIGFTYGADPGPGPGPDPQPQSGSGQMGPRRKTGIGRR